MKKFSSYLKKKKPLVKELVSKLNEKFDFASVLATDVDGTMYMVDKSSTAIRPTYIAECGFVARVFKDNVYSEYSFNELKSKDIDGIVNKIIKLADSNIVTDKVKAKLIEEEKIQESFARKEVGHKYGDEEIISILTELKDYGFSLYPNIINVQVGFETNHYSKMYISNSKDLEQFYVYNNYYSFVMVRGENDMKYAYDGYGGNNPKKEFKILRNSVKECAVLANDLLKAELPKPGVYTIVTDPSITGLIAHEAFGHGLEMDMWVKDRAKSQEYMNKKVASNLVTMHDGANSAFSAASYFFDDEGAMGSDTVIIDKGILVGGICDSISASQLNYKPTGNGRRQSYKRKSYTRMTNTYFDCIDNGVTLKDIIRSVDYGYYVSCTNNGMEDPKNWGIQCTALYGREIKNGKFTGKIISPVVMSGYVIDLLESISMVANTKEVIGSGSCGKGYKEWVRVSDGGASMKCKVKIG